MYTRLDVIDLCCCGNGLVALAVDPRCYADGLVAMLMVGCYGGIPPLIW